MRILVIGAGPAGLIAAHEFNRKMGGEMFVDIDIISDSVKPSVIGGAQFLHEPIPGISTPEDMLLIKFQKRGDAKVYAEKIYNDAATNTSWDGYSGVVEGYMLRDAYHVLWKKWQNRIKFGKVDRNLLSDLMGLSEDPSIPSINQIYGPDKIASYDLIVDTAPMSVHCRKLGNQWVGPGPVHMFEGAHIFLGYSEKLAAEPNTILYSGSRSDEWYRYSNIAGEGWYEFGGMADMSDQELDKLGIKDLIPGVKPIRTTCNCYSDQVENGQLLRLGRFGSWKRGYLLHHVISDVDNYIKRFVK